jgi:MFS family permease
LCALGLIGAGLYARLPEAPPQEKAERPTLLGPSKGIVYKLAALFSLDAFAGGFIVQSLMALWLFERFGLSLAEASLLFFWTGVLSAFSYPVAARLADRIGLINTMVFTHIPSSVCLILAAFSSNLTLVLTLLLVRAALSQMDVPTRSSYVMAVVTPAERAAAASVTAVPRSLAASLSPTLAGIMLATPFSGLPLVVCGAGCLRWTAGRLDFDMYWCRRTKMDRGTGRYRALEIEGCEAGGSGEVSAVTSRWNVCAGRICPGEVQSAGGIAGPCRRSRLACAR